MARRRRSVTVNKTVDVDVSVDVDLTDFEDDELLEEMERCGLISARQRQELDRIGQLDLTLDQYEYEFAVEEMRRGRRDEAVIHLERSLPSKIWMGALAGEN
jgi:hypothetical protein